MIHTKDGNHGLRCYSRFLTRTNQCIHCRSVFKSRETAQSHTFFAEKFGNCPTSRSIYTGPLIKITDLCCVVCGEQCSSHESMQTHLATHSLNPPTSFTIPQHIHTTAAEQLAVPHTMPRSRLAGNASRRRDRAKNSQSRVRDAIRGTLETAAHRQEMTRSTLQVSAEIYSIARQVAGDRERMHGKESVQVDSLAATLARSDAVRRYLRQGNIEVAPTVRSTLDQRINFESCR